MEQRVRDLKEKNIEELKQHIRPGDRKVLRHRTKITLTYPSPFGMDGTDRGRSGSSRNNENDMIVKSPLGKKYSTIELSEALSGLPYDVDTLHRILRDTLEFTSTKDEKFTDDEEQRIHFTIPNYREAMNECRDPNIQILLLQMIMIGVNDNGRYRDYRSSYSGYANHMSTAIAAFHLVHRDGYTEIKRMLSGKRIYTYENMSQYLRRGQIIRYDEIAGLL